MANMLNAHSVPNLLTPEPNNFRISILNNGSAGPEDLAKLIITAQGRTLLPRRRV